MYDLEGWEEVLRQARVMASPGREIPFFVLVSTVALVQANVFFCVWIFVCFSDSQ